MTITVQGPDGVVIDFPDGTDQATIAKAMQQASGGAAPPPVDPNLLETRRARLRQGLEAAKPAPWVSALGGALDMATFGTLDELSAGLRTGAGLWGNYDKALGEERETLKAAQEAHPVIFGAGQVGGGLATMAIPGLNVARAASLPGMVARGVWSGGVMGAMYGYGSGDGGPLSMDRLAGAGVGAGIGAATGGAVPLIGRGAGNTWRAIINGGSGNRAANLAARAATDDALTTQQMVQRLADLGPEGMVADLGPNLQRQAGALAATPSPGQQIVRDALTARGQGANARITGDIDATLGPAPSPSEVTGFYPNGDRVPPDFRNPNIPSIADNQAALSPQYQAVLANARAVDTSQLALNLDSMVVNERGPAQQAAQAVRNMLDIAGPNGSAHLDPNPATLLATRNAIDGLIGAQAGPNADRNVLRVLEGARRQVDQLLTTAVPGIKDVDARYAELARQRGAFDAGQQTLDSGRTTLRPQELQNQADAGAIPRGNAVGPSAVPFRLSQGARAEIDRIIGTNNNDVVALNRLIKGEGSWNRDRLATLFGQQRADELIRVLDRERTFADTASVVMRNSETAARQAAQAEVAPGARVVPRVPWSITDAIPRIANALLGARSAARQRATDEALAGILTGQGQQATAGVQSVAEAIARRNRQIAVEQGINYLLTPAARGLTAQTTQALPF